MISCSSVCSPKGSYDLVTLHTQGIKHRCHSMTFDVKSKARTVVYQKASVDLATDP